MSSPDSTAGLVDDLRLPADLILEGEPVAVAAAASVIGRSREGNPIYGYRLGEGEIGVSLIAGCHADEPVGPEMLRRLCGSMPTVGSSMKTS